MTPDQVRRVWISARGVKRSSLWEVCSGPAPLVDLAKPSKIFRIAVRQARGTTRWSPSCCRPRNNARPLRPGGDARRAARLSRANTVEKRISAPPNPQRASAIGDAISESSKQSLRINLRLLSQGGEDAAAQPTTRHHGEGHRAASQGPLGRP